MHYMVDQPSEKGWYGCHCGRTFCQGRQSDHSHALKRGSHFSCHLKQIETRTHRNKHSFSRTKWINLSKAHPYFWHSLPLTLSFFPISFHYRAYDYHTHFSLWLKAPFNCLHNHQPMSVSQTATNREREKLGYNFSTPLPPQPHSHLSSHIHTVTEHQLINSATRCLFAWYNPFFPWAGKTMYNWPGLTSKVHVRLFSLPVSITSPL